MIAAGSCDDGRAAAKHRLYERKRQPFGARGQEMKMVTLPYVCEIAFKATNTDAISQSKVMD
jgi:hypothetical protein